MICDNFTEAFFIRAEQEQKLAARKAESQLRIVEEEEDREPR